MTLRSSLAGLVLCMWCSSPAALLAQVPLSPAAWQARDAYVSSAAPPDPSVYPLRLSDRRPTASTDRWWAMDKAQHVAFSFLWTLSAQYVLVDKGGWSNQAALPAAVGSGAAVGLSKELFDWRIGPAGRFSTRDLFADAAGILLAVGVIVL